MERFREHEKEFKTKQYSQKNLVKTVRNGGGAYSNESDDDMDGRDDDEDYGSDNEDSDYKNIQAISNAEQLAKDKEFLAEFSKDYLKLLICKVEEELEGCKSKKVKGATSKKQKEKVGVINNKLTSTKRVKERIDDITNQIEFIEGGTIMKLRDLLKNYYDKPDDEACLDQMNLEINRILELIDQQKKAISHSQQVQLNQQRALEIKARVDFDKHLDVLKEYCRVDQT
ncbi:MAG: hypothetical protein ACMG6E_09800 [Candidatus Roizmanbacteria bacterium]